MLLLAFSAKVQIRFPHLLHYAGSSTTSQVASSSEMLLIKDQVTSLPNPQTNGSLRPSFPERPPLPTPGILGRRKGCIIGDSAPAADAILCGSSDMVEGKVLSCQSWVQILTLPLTRCSRSLCFPLNGDQNLDFALL